MKQFASAILIAGLTLLPDGRFSRASANDTAAELSVGGLIFKKSNSVSIESEDLTITPDAVTVRYRFVNRSPKSVTLTVAFPLPDIDLSEAANFAIPVGDSMNFVGFETKIDGKPAVFKLHQHARLGDKDVSASLKEFGIPFLPLGDLRSRIAALPDTARTKLIDQGLMVQSGSNERGQPLYDAGWTVSTSAVREQTFEPGRPVEVEHRYRTSLGMSFDTVLRKGSRQNKAFAKEVQRYRKEFCVNDRFLADLDKLAGASEANTQKVQERRISYVLKTGANWAGPIKQFRLVVDAGKPGRLTSFCAPNIKRVSPTVWEARAENFTPTENLKILMVGQF